MQDIFLHWCIKTCRIINESFFLYNKLILNNKKIYLLSFWLIKSILFCFERYICQKKQLFFDWFYGSFLRQWCQKDIKNTFFCLKNKKKAEFCKKNIAFFTKKRYMVNWRITLRTPHVILRIVNCFAVTALRQFF